MPTHLTPFANRRAARIARLASITGISLLVLVLGVAACGSGAEPPNLRYRTSTDAGRSVGVGAGADAAIAPPPPMVSPARVEVPLTQLPFVVVENGYGPLEKNRSNGNADAGDGALISIAGTTYEHGVGIHSRSEITLELSGKYERFVSDVGIDDEVKGLGGSLVFQVLVDGQKAAESPIMKAASAPFTIDVSVVGAQKLVLVVTDAGDGTDYDHGDWAGARLVVD